MRKLCISFMCILLFFANASAADKIWIGPGGGNWSTPGNWAGGLPGAADRAVFNTNALVNVDPASITLLGIYVTNNAAVQLNAGANTTINVTGTIFPNRGLTIDAGSTLTNRTTADISFDFIFGANAVGLVSGNWNFEGTVLINISGGGANFNLAASSLLTVNGRLTMGINSTDITASSISSLVFGAGSFYTILADGGTVPDATYNTTSTIEVLGSITSLPKFSGGFTPSYGNIFIDIPGVDDSYSIALPDDALIKGNLTINNTNNQTLVLMGNNEVSFTSPVTLNLNGNLSVNGPNAKVAFAETDLANQNKDYQLIIGGNYVQTGGEFSLQQYNDMVGVTTVKLAGNFNQTAGIFTANSTATNNTSNLFLLELNGTVAQTVNSVPGTIDNAQNMVALAINNAAGVTLNAPLSAGRIAFLNGILNTSASAVFTVNNPSSNSIVVSNAGTGKFINGPVTRNTNTANPYLFPVGKGTVYDSVMVTPSSAANSSYTAEYFNAGYSDLSIGINLLGVANNEYWNIVKNSGAEATVQLALNAVVPGATAADTVLIAKYDGADWQNARGNTGLFVYPGDVATGIVVSELAAATTGFYTFGFKRNLALPVLLLNFTVEKAGAGALLEWTVDRNTIPKTFEILKSEDGRNFQVLKVLNGVNNVTAYSTIDPLLVKGTNYYRLRMTERSGEVTLSKIIAVIHQAKGFTITNMAPTLVTNNAVLTISTSKGGSMELLVTDMNGRVWRKLGLSIPTGNSKQTIQLGDLAAGMYQITGKLEGVVSSPIRFVKQ